MIIPTAEYDPLFARDGIPFSEKMVDYIEREFGELLGADADLRQRVQGLRTRALSHSTISSLEPGMPAESARQHDAKAA